MQAAGVAVPPPKLIEIEAGQMTYEPNERREQEGVHFGSTFPGSPDKMAVFDLLPQRVIGSVANRAHFLGAFVTDKWLGNTDSRQAVFFRDFPRSWIPNTLQRSKELVALMIDQGNCFGGDRWEFYDSHLYGLHPIWTVYHSALWPELHRWITAVHAIPEQVIEDAFDSLPGQWTTGEVANLSRLKDTVLARRPKLSRLVEAAVDCLPHVFIACHRGGQEETALSLPIPAPRTVP